MSPLKSLLTCTPTICGIVQLGFDCFYGFGIKDAKSFNLCPCGFQVFLWIWDYDCLKFLTLLIENGVMMFKMIGFTCKDLNFVTVL